MANHPDEFEGVYMPSWVRLLLIILRSQGVATVISLALVWFVMTVIWNGMNDLKRDDASMLKAQQDANVEMRAFVSRQDAYDKERSELLKGQLRIARQTCAAVAKTDVERKGCWE